MSIVKSLHKNIHFKHDKWYVYKKLNWVWSWAKWVKVNLKAFTNKMDLKTFNMIYWIIFFSNFDISRDKNNGPFKNVIT